MLGCLPAQSQSRMLKDIAAVKGVESVYVGKFLLKGFDVMSGFSGVELDGVIDSLDCIEVATAGTPESIAKVKPLLEALIRNHAPKFEILVETIEEDETTVIYGDIRDRMAKCILIVNSDSYEINVIALRGNIDVEKLASLNP